MSEMTSTATEIFDPYDYDFHEDPYPVYARLRDEAPLYYNASDDFWALSRHADVHAAVKNDITFSNRMGVSLDASAWNDWSEIRVGFGWDDYPVAQWINRKINAQNKGTSGPIGSVQTSNWNGSTSSTVFTKPSSTHPGSVNVAFADMHVRPLNQDIGYHVYAQLCTPWGRQARDSGGGAINQWGTLNTYMQQPLNEQDIR